MARAVGIDLGTTNSVISVLEGGEPTVIVNSEGRRTTPSVVAFAKSGEVLVGEAAKRQAVTNVERTFRSVKRHMGTDWSVLIDGKKYTAQEIAARVLMKLKRDAESYLGEAVTDVVITVPAYFEDAQRQATKEAGQIAGLHVLRIVNEPTAAGLAYGLDRGEEELTVVVVHFGGGTFDVSLLEIGEGVVEVLATSGDTRLGGDDWDQRIINWLVEKFKAGTGIDLTKDKMAMQRLRDAAEQAKIELSHQLTATINLPYLCRSADGPLHLNTSLTRAEFQRMTADLIDRCRAPFNNVIKDAGISVGSIDRVVLVGGSTRMPAVGDLVRELTDGKAPNRGVNPDEVVGIGAALQAGVLKGEVKDVMLLDVTPLSLGIETKGGVMTKLIERNTTIPTKRSELFTTAGGTELRPADVGSREVDLDGLIRGEDDSAESGEESQKRGERNYQSSALIRVYVGERDIAAYNKKLGMFELTGLPQRPYGEPRIEVTFDVDANGIVHVSAKDLGTGKEQSMTITGGSALPKDEIDRMIRDAELHAEQDRRRREEAETRNQAETLVYQTEKFISENDEKLPADLKNKVNIALGEANEALKGTDVTILRSAMEKLATESQAMGAALYAQHVDDETIDYDDDLVDAEIVDEGAMADEPASARTSVRRDRIFLCHSHGDKEAVRRLYGRLCADGFDPWLDEEDLLPGQDWAFEIRQVMRASRFVLVCLSVNSTAKRGFVQREIGFALDVAEEQPEGSIYLIPVRLEPCDVPERLSRWHTADLFVSGSYDRLLRTLRHKM